MEQNRLKSPVVWLAVVSQLTLILTIFNPELSEQFKIIASAILEIFTVLGVLNNPTNKSGF